MRWVAVGLAVTVGVVCAGLAEASGEARPVTWTRAPDLVPWETMTTSGDPDRVPALDRQALRERRLKIRAFLDSGRADPRERAAALAELGDLFRDEARLVLAEDAADPLRIPLRTTPAWLQLEFALRQYDEAVNADAGAVDGDGRLTLLRAVIARRLGESDGLEDALSVIRTYRGTPYVEMAKLAVGDHHFATGDLEAARSAYQKVRSNRDRELSAYAEYRLASIYARTGQADKARDILQNLLEDTDPGPFPDMLRDAARSALTNHLAAERPLIELLPWLHQACSVYDDACVAELRTAAADTYHRRGNLTADAWLRTVDATPLVARDLDTRLTLAALMRDEAGSVELLQAAEDLCPPNRAMCRAEMAHAVASFYAETGDPEGTWLQDYVRLPRLPDRPDVQRFVARVTREPGRPTQELADIEALCRDDACMRRMHQHLRIVWGRLSRLHDAAWLHFVDEGIPLPGPPDVELRARELVRARAPAPDMLRELEPLCAGARACEDELYELLVGYYAAVGQDSEASWLIAYKTLPELPIPEARREVLRQAALAGSDGPTMLGELLTTCEVVDPVCFSTARVAAETFLRAAARHRDAVEVADLAVVNAREHELAVFPVLVRVVLEDLSSTAALEAVETACVDRPGTCGAQARATLVDWYESQGRYAEASAVARIDAPPDLGEWDRLAPAFLRIARTSPDGADAAIRVTRLCPVTAPACQDALLDALALWYEGQGRPDDAAAVRQR